MIKRADYQNVYALNSIFKIFDAKQIGEMNQSTVIAGDFNFSLKSVADRIDRKSVTTESEQRHQQTEFDGHV